MNAHTLGDIDNQLHIGVVIVIGSAGYLAKEG